MNALVVYDTTFGNTGMIANTIGDEIHCRVLRVGEVKPNDFIGLDLLIVGSPTHGGWPTPEIFRLMEPSLSLRGVKVAAFDTRTERFSWIFGYAAQKIAERLEKMGGELLVPPEGFIVIKNKGPLKDSEHDHAVHWGKLILRNSMGKE